MGTRGGNQGKISRVNPRVRDFRGQKLFFGVGNVTEPKKKKKKKKGEGRRQSRKLR